MIASRRMATNIQSQRWHSQRLFLYHSPSFSNSRCIAMAKPSSDACSVEPGTVGAIEDNCDKVLAAAAEADRQGADLLVCSELALTGYPPEICCCAPI